MQNDGMSIKEWVLVSPLSKGYLDLADKVRRRMMREFMESMSRGVLPPRAPANWWLHDLYYYVSRPTWEEASMEPLGRLLPQGPVRASYVALTESARQVQMRDFLAAQERGVMVPRTLDKEWLYQIYARASLAQWREASGEDQQV